MLYHSLRTVIQQHSTPAPFFTVRIKESDWQELGQLIVKASVGGMLLSYERAKLLNEINIAIYSFVPESVAVEEGAFQEFVERLDFAKAQLTGMVEMDEDEVD